MPEFNIQSDSVDVERIMEQIRERVRAKRGVDYTEQQIQELAAVKLERFLDPSRVRSDLLDQFRRQQPPYRPPELPNYAFEEQTLYESHRAPLRWIRKLLRPLLKLFFNPNPLIQALNIQARLNAGSAEREAHREASRHALDQLYYEVIHNLVIETTRMTIEGNNLKMRVESLTSRLEFNERRARALEGVVLYKPSPDGRAGSGESVTADEPLTPEENRTDEATPTDEGPGQRSRRRRRRRGRRGGTSASAVMEQAGDRPSSTEVAQAPITESPPDSPGRDTPESVEPRDAGSEPEPGHADRSAGSEPTEPQ